MRGGPQKTRMRMGSPQLGRVLLLFGDFRGREGAASLKVIVFELFSFWGFGILSLGMKSKNLILLFPTLQVGVVRFYLRSTSSSLLLLFLLPLRPPPTDKNNRYRPHRYRPHISPTSGAPGLLSGPPQRMKRTDTDPTYP